MAKKIENEGAKPEDKTGFLKHQNNQIYMQQGRRKLRLIPAGLTSFGCRG
jgi:hypothetical protein